MSDSERRAGPDRRSAPRRADDAAWERWRMASLDAGVAARPAMRRGPEAQAPAAPPGVAELEAIAVEARQAGYAEGQAQARQEAKRFSALTAELQGALAAFEQRVAEDILALALEVARQVVRQAVSVKPELLLEVIREGLSQMPHGHAAIHLHPDDASLVRLYLGEQFAHLGHRIHEDRSSARGGCVIDANGSQLDASLATRWKRVVEAIGARSDWLETPAGEGAP